MYFRFCTKDDANCKYVVKFFVCDDSSHISVLMRVGNPLLDGSIDNFYLMIFLQIHK